MKRSRSGCQMIFTMNASNPQNINDKRTQQKTVNSCVPHIIQELLQHTGFFVAMFTCLQGKLRLAHQKKKEKDKHFVQTQRGTKLY